MLGETGERPYASHDLQGLHFLEKKDCFAVYCILTSLKDSYCFVPKALTNLTTLLQVLT